MKQKMNNSSKDLSDKIVQLLNETTSLRYLGRPDLFDQNNLAEKILDLANKGHTFDSLVKYRNEIQKSWDKLQGCYDDISDPDIGEIRIDNIRGHIDDLNDYIPRLTEQLPRAIESVGPRLSPIIFDILDVFENYRGKKLLRGTAWNYKLSFLTALGNVKGLFDDLQTSLDYNPLVKIKESFIESLEGGQKQGEPFDSILTSDSYALKKMQYKLNNQVKSPQDIKGIEKLIRDFVSDYLGVK